MSTFYPFKYTQYLFELLPRFNFGKTHHVLELQDLLEFSAFKLGEGTASLALKYFTHPAYRCFRWTKKGHVIRIAAVRDKIHNFFVGEVITTR